jgi:hypothetical protein
MSGSYFGERSQDRFRNVLNALIECAESAEKPLPFEQVSWKSCEVTLRTQPKYKAREELKHELVVRINGPISSISKLPECKGRYNGKELSEIFSCLENTVGILAYHSDHPRKGTQGSKFWRFSLFLWSTDLEKNMVGLKKWHQDRQHNKKQKSLPKLKLEDIKRFCFGGLPPGSPYYIERPEIETLAKNEFTTPGALIRVLAPRYTGKTSFLHHLSLQARNSGYRTIYINLNEIKTESLLNLNTFLLWFCIKIGYELNSTTNISQKFASREIPAGIQTAQIFDEDFAPIHLPPLFIALDEFDLLFHHLEWSERFLGILRTWLEKAKAGVNNQWSRTQFAIAYSTEQYIQFDIKSSPLNIGCRLELTELTQQQVQSLVEIHSLQWNEEQILRLMEMVGGHPYLIQLAIYHAKNRSLTLETILKQAPTISGIYFQSHLQILQEALLSNNILKRTFQEIISSDTSVALPSSLSQNLYRLGLIKFNGNKVTLRNQLYRLYFGNIQW